MPSPELDGSPAKELTHEKISKTLTTKAGAAFLALGAVVVLVLVLAASGALYPVEVNTSGTSSSSSTTSDVAVADVNLETSGVPKLTIFTTEGETIEKSANTLSTEEQQGIIGQDVTTAAADEFEVGITAINQGYKLWTGYVISKYATTAEGKPITDYKIEDCDLYWRNATEPNTDPFSYQKPGQWYLDEQGEVLTSEPNEGGSVRAWQYNNEPTAEFGKNFLYSPKADLSANNNYFFLAIGQVFKFDPNKVEIGSRYELMRVSCEMEKKSDGTKTAFTWDPSPRIYYKIVDDTGNSSSTSSSSGLSSVIMYRYYNTKKGVHFYTDNKAAMERFPDYEFEKKAFKIFPKSNASAYAGNSNIVPVYRFYNPETGAHFYTADANQASRVRTNYSPPFIDEGIKFYVYKPSSSEGVELRKFFNSSTGAHFFTAFPSEIDALTNDSRFNSIFDNEGTAFRVIAL